MSNLDYEVTEYALHHKTAIKSVLNKLSNEAKDNPILHSYYKDAALEEIRQYLAEQLESSYIDVAEIVDTEFMDRYFNE